MAILNRAGKPALHYVIDDFTDPWRNAPYLILQHGNGRSSQFWYRWVPYLARFYKVVRPDVRGLGGSSAEFDLDHEFTLEHCVNDLIDIIHDLDADSVHLCICAANPLAACFVSLSPRCTLHWCAHSHWSRHRLSSTRWARSPMRWGMSRGMMR